MTGFKKMSREEIATDLFHRLGETPSEAQISKELKSRKRFNSLLGRLSPSERALIAEHMQNMFSDGYILGYNS